LALETGPVRRPRWHMQHLLIARGCNDRRPVTCQPWPPEDHTLQSLGTTGQRSNLGPVGLAAHAPGVSQPGQRLWPMGGDRPAADQVPADGWLADSGGGGGRCLG
jgi:hypothetical protein